MGVLATMNDTMGRHSRPKKAASEDEPAAPGVPYLPLDTRTSRVCGDDPVRIVFFCLGAGYLTPWNAFITAVDYFASLYPGAHIDRVFTVAYLIPALASLALLVARGQLLSARSRINSGLALLFLSIVAVPVMDAAVVRGSGSAATLAATVAAVAMAGIGDSLVQGTLIGSAGLLPGRYMQAIMAGTGFSGVIVCALRIATKLAFSDTAGGLRASANVYFAVSAVCLVGCIVAYNRVYAQTVEVPRDGDGDGDGGQGVKEEEGRLVGSDGDAEGGRSVLYVLGRIRWLVGGLGLIYVVTLAIFPGILAEDVSSAVLGDWYAVLLITCYNVFDLLGKTLPARWAASSGHVCACAGAVARVLFVPLYSLCVHGPAIFRTEVPVSVLTALLGLTNGYLTTCFFLLAPEAIRGAGVAAAHTAGVIMVLGLVVGLTIGSLLGWVWVF